METVHAPYRIAAPREPEPPDPADAYESLLRERARRFRPLVLAGVGLAVLGLATTALGRRAPPPRGPTFEEQAAHEIERARSVLEDARAEAMNEQLRFADAFVSVRAAPPRTTAARCEPVATGTPYVVVRADDPDLRSPSVARVMRDIVRAEELLGNGRSMEGILYANALGPTSATPLLARLRQDVVVIASELRQPERTTSASFVPGKIAGRVLVYDFAEHRVTCSGEVEVESSTQIAYAFEPAHLNGPIAATQGPSLTATLTADLDKKLEAAVARGPLLRVLTR